jgi:chaperonin GroES
MIKPIEDKVVIKPIIEQEKKTASGFILAGSKEEKPSEGIVVAVGPGLVLGNGNVMVPDVSVGDKVVFAKYQGTEVEHDGENYLILAYRDIFAVIGDNND